MLTQNEKQEIIDLYQSGLNVKQVAKQLQRGKRTVNQILDDANVLRSKRTTPEMENEIINLYEKGCSQSELHKKYNCTRNTIRTILKRNNVDITPWEHVRLKPEQIEELRQMWRNGVSRPEILSYFKTSAPTLNRWIKLLGEPLRRKAPSGEKHGSWKGGMSVTGNGYINKWLSPDDPYFCMANGQGYTPEHRYVMAQYFGRPLRKDESVHHISGDKKDNRIENLQLRINQHGTGQCFKCNNCGSTDVEPVEIAD
jgi:transposase